MNQNPVLSDERFAIFGEAVWDFITKSGIDFCGEEISEDILPLARDAGLCDRVPYDPTIHGEDIEADPGDEIWWWGSMIDLARILKKVRCYLARLAARARGGRRIRHNQCPACNSDAPGVDSCPICEGYDSRNWGTVYPPEEWRKLDWRNRYGSYLEYLYVENPPELVWNGKRWVEKR